MKQFVKGALVASAVAGLVMTVGCGDNTGTNTDEVKCSGVNDCSGKGECGAADGSHDCAGKNECKGKGWVKMSKEDCTAKNGTVVE